MDRSKSLAELQLRSGAEALPAAKCLEMFTLMARARAMEERMIQMAKSGESYFWVGGPGEEALNVALGLQVRRGRGPRYDYLHLHYRSSAVMLAMGMPMLDAIRQAAMRVTDPFSQGRNFVGHFACREWNVMPVSSVIEVQHAAAAGTALMQKRSEHDGVTVVTGGDAGTAEGDFASCLIWSTRPGNEVPVLIVVANNGWGISTAAATQHSEKSIAERAKPFGIPTEVIDGNDPVACWNAVRRAIAYCRRQRRPYLLEAMVSRLYGHSSASGAERAEDEADCVADFQRRLIRARILDAAQAEQTRREAHREAEKAAEQARQEPPPAASQRWRHTYAPSPVDAVYPDDYTGLPD